jgi:hypothetical protein
LSTIVGFDLAFIIIACALSRNAIVEAASNEESDAAVDTDAPIDAAAVAVAAAGSAGGGRTHERTTHASRLKTVAATAAKAAAAGGGGGGGDRGSNSGYKKPEGNGQ